MQEFADWFMRHIHDEKFAMAEWYVRTSTGKVEHNYHGSEREGWRAFVRDCFVNKYPPAVEAMALIRDHNWPHYLELVAMQKEIV
jgi:hypothetical protein